MSQATVPHYKRPIAIKCRSDFDKYLNADGVFTQPVLITSHVGDLFEYRDVHSLHNVTIDANCFTYVPIHVTSLDGLVCRDNVTLVCRTVESLGNASIGNNCTLIALQKLRTVGTATLGKRCKLSDLADPVDLGTPKLTKAEMKIVRQINTRKCYMNTWHGRRDHCGTVHCLAGWAHALLEPNWQDQTSGDAKDAGFKHLPGLCHLFYAFHAETSVRKMIKRLQALPE